MNIQIGVMGSMGDGKLRKFAKTIAQELGIEIARNDCTLLFGFEGDFDSFSSIAARAAEGEGGITIAFLWGTKGADIGPLRSIKVETGQLRGGGREFPLVLSCDAIICIGGGSGTLTEMVMAYQKNIPVIVLKDSGGWSDKLANEYLDERKRMKVVGVKTAKEAVATALSLIKKNKGNRLGGKKTIKNIRLVRPQ